MPDDVEAEAGVGPWRPVTVPGYPNWAAAPPRSPGLVICVTIMQAKLAARPAPQLWFTRVTRSADGSSAPRAAPPRTQPPTTNSHRFTPAVNPGHSPENWPDVACCEEYCGDARCGRVGLGCLSRVVIVSCERVWVGSLALLRAPAMALADQPEPDQPERTRRPWTLRHPPRARASTPNSRGSTSRSAFAATSSPSRRLLNGSQASSIRFEL